MTTTKDSHVSDTTKSDAKSADTKAADGKATESSSSGAAKAQLKDSDQAKTDNPGGLAPAGQSGDPTVQKLLAEREIHRLNAGLVDDEETKRNREQAQQEIDRIDDELAKLGYTAK
jgi:hypothetical protein